MARALQLLARLRRRALLGLWLCVASSACGDDDSMAAPDDGGFDGGLPPPHVIIRHDGGMSLTDPVPVCSRADPLACGPGQHCHPLIRRAAGELNYSLYAGCVSDQGGRGLGAPCEPWGGARTQYRAEGLEDELYLDPCDQGLFCAPDPAIRNANTCQTACIEGVGCPTADQICVGSNDLDSVCPDAERCDPYSGNGCAVGSTCYPILDSSLTRVITDCFPTPEAPLADGELCNFIGGNECRPGSACWGPPRLSVNSWTIEKLRCRRSCEVPESASGSDLDGGASDDDAGMSYEPGICPNICSPVKVSGLDVSRISDAFGQCE